MDASPLNKLAAELRNNIAELALRHDDRLEIWYPTATAEKSEDLVITADGMSDYNPAALVKTCKQMREEYLKLFWASNKFTVHVEAARLEESVAGVLRAISEENLNFVPSLTIEVDLGTFSDSDLESTTSDRLALKPQPTDHALASFAQSFRHHTAESPSSLLKGCEVLYLNIRYKVVGGNGAVHQSGLLLDLRDTALSIRAARLNLIMRSFDLDDCAVLGYEIESHVCQVLSRRGRFKR